MRPLCLSLLAVCLSVPASAQSFPDRKGGEAPPPEAERARRPDGESAARDGKAADEERKAVAAKLAAQTPEEKFFDWFASGAFKPAPLSCAEQHDLTERNKFAKKTYVERDGLRYGFNWLIAVGSNAELCLKRDNNGLSSDALLPNPPNAWLATLDQKKDESILQPLFGYDDAASKPGAKAIMVEARAAFWERAMRKVLSNVDARVKICAKIAGGPNCPDTIAGMKLDDLYEVARKPR